MIEFRFSVDIDGVERGLHALAESLEDVTTPLLRTGGAIRSRAKKLFASEGNGKWDKLADSTLARKPNAAMVKLLTDKGRGIHGERSIIERIARDSAGVDKWKKHVVGLNVALAEASAKGRKTKGLETRRERALKQANDRIGKILKHADEARRAGIVKGGVESKRLGSLPVYAVTISDPARVLREMTTFAKREVARAKAHRLIRRSVKQLERAGYGFAKGERERMLRQKAARYQHGEAATRMLGNLVNSMSLKVEGTHLDVYSKARFSAVHNDGGTAGHGAQIPQREFLYLTDADLDVFVEAWREAGLDAWREA